jgi:hypothetical protein
MKVIFQDVDGPLIPGRMYYSKHSTYSFDKGLHNYDPVAVGMLRELCRRFNAKIVYNTAHNEEDYDRMRAKARHGGFEDLLHEDCRTDFVVDQTYEESPSRIASIRRWLAKHPEITDDDWIVIDDESDIHNTRQVTIDFNLGMTINNFFHACKLFGDDKAGAMISWT